MHCVFAIDRTSCLLRWAGYSKHTDPVVASMSRGAHFSDVQGVTMSRGYIGYVKRGKSCTNYLSTGTICKNYDIWGGGHLIIGSRGLFW